MDWIKTHKVLVGVIVFIVLIGIVGASEGNSDNQTKPTASTKTSEQSKPVQQSQPAIPKYDLVGEYGSDRSGKVYVIAPADATEDKLTLIIKELDKKYGYLKYLRVAVFTDVNQAKILAINPLDTTNLEAAAADAYDKAFVASFNVNKTTGLRQFVIFPSTENKEIKI